MALTETTPEADRPTLSTDAPPTPGAIERLFGSGDHVAIGRLYIGFALAFATLSLTLLAVTGFDILTNNGFLGSRPDQLAASAQVGVVFLGVMPLLLGIALAVVPLQLGSPAIAFPRAAALSLWTWLISSGIFITSVAMNGGVLGANSTAAKLGNASFGAILVSLGLAAVCVATTVIAHRPLGMRLAYVPGLAWAAFVAASVWIVTLGAGFAHVVLGQIGRMGAPELAKNFSGGLIWLFRGPTVFVFAVPLLGIAADVVVAATGRRFGRPGRLQLVIGAYAVLSFGAWAQMPSSMNTAMWTLFAIAVAIPVLGLFGVLGANLRRGEVTTSPALTLSLAGLILLLGAVVTGWIQALSLSGKGTLFATAGVGMAAAQTAFVATAAIAGGLAASMHWAPLLWGGSGRTTESRLTVPLVVFGGALLSTATLVQAVGRYTGHTQTGEVLGLLEAIGSILLALGALSGLIAAIRLAAGGQDPGPVEGAATLEWSFPTPAGGGVGLPDLARVSSPYPLLDAPSGQEEKD